MLFNILANANKNQKNYYFSVRNWLGNIFLKA